MLFQGNEEVKSWNLKLNYFSDFDELISRSALVPTPQLNISRSSLLPPPNFHTMSSSNGNIYNNDIDFAALALKDAEFAKVYASILPFNCQRDPSSPDRPKAFISPALIYFVRQI